MINLKFIAIVSISFVIAIPITYFIVTKYFSEFMDHCPIYWWIFALGYAIALVLSILVVTLTCYKASIDNPVNTLQKE
ncbi:MAG: hypothetical protein MJ211_15155 [Bacteroidales bacterium]|nr:hypothetical protein [Bacteroidales bacterium]